MRCGVLGSGEMHVGRLERTEKRVSAATRPLDWIWLLAELTSSDCEGVDMYLPHRMRTQYH